MSDDPQTFALRLLREANKSNAVGVAILDALLNQQPPHHLDEQSPDPILPAPLRPAHE